MWRALLAALLVAQFARAQDDMGSAEELVLVEDGLLRRILNPSEELEMDGEGPRKVIKRCRWKLCGAGRRFRYN
ncbi:unnamed protein product, partial [Mesorhabditis spiculigera]